MTNQWDTLRISTYELLLDFPNPIPGFGSISSVEALVNNGLKLTQSLRMREASHSHPP